MKKFSFPLETVLKYKNDVLENLRNEHGKIMQRVILQEEYILGLQDEYDKYNEIYKEKKLLGMTIIEASTYELYFREMELRLKNEYDKLAQLKELSENKRKEVVEAKKETASIDKLKEKKVEQYNKSIQKSEEIFIEEFVTNSRLTASR